MDYFKLAASIPLEYLIIRNILLRYISQEQLTINDKKFLYPLENFDKSKLSLTDRISPDDQIRYYLSDKVFRKVAELAKKIATSEIKTINITAKFSSYPLINCFIQALYRMNISVNLIVDCAKNEEIYLTENETKLINELIKEKFGDIDIIQPYILMIINSGDIYSADHLIEHCLEYFDNYEKSQALIIGTIKNCINKPIEAEYNYIKSKESENPLSIIKANYTLSMLYLRHHKSNKRNIEKGRQFLQEAYNIIQTGKLDYLEQDKKNFFTVFNRNGYGLILFREGNADEAIRLLNWGLQQLSDKHSMHYMHRSVIIYNICLCYKQLGKYDDAITYLNQLIEIDYAFPEYHLELAICFYDKGNITSYIKNIQRALSVSPMHSDSHYHMSIAFLSSEDYISAEKHARLAWEISGDNLTAYNYAYILSLNSNYKILDHLMQRTGIFMTPEWLILQAEKIAQSSEKAAYNYLLKCQHIFPNNPLVKENIKMLSM
ncbi:tetratricopeptide repeat protein [Providencia sp. M-27]|uniref:tetratricopeptide repeat protein n=1 Tax=Providencia sp. M-27 TaxID=2713150 RepID=UPI00140E789B|nr:tetratricopeptide repeat protein [Providencia sp. M-27]